MEFPGACYHVINRGNYRQRIFASEGTAASFETTLFEACERLGWRLHAYVIMDNHFHLALETPLPNLSVGMKWLQGTFATRFNRFFGQVGRPFQGRFKSLIVEPGHALAQVAHYIHLNPVRAGLCAPDRAVDYRWSSLRRYVAGNRPETLEPATLLAASGNLKDTRHGWRKYQDYLAFLATDLPAQKEMRFSEMCTGWCHGSDRFEEEMSDDYARRVTEFRREHGGPESLILSSVREKQWEAALKRGSDELKLDLTQLPVQKSDRAKVALACAMRSTTTATNEWLAVRLGMGRPASVSQFVRRFRMSGQTETQAYRSVLSRVKQ